MSLNRIYCGRPMDLNIGNGKTASAVGAIVDLWAYTLKENLPEKQIFSNITLNEDEIDYQMFTPKDLYEVLDTKNAIVLLDELHAIVHINHKIHEGCTKHSVRGLCYHLSEFFRQVRKRDIDTYTTCQRLYDAPMQYREMMNVQIECKLFHWEGQMRKACTPLKYPGQKCPPWHKHIIRQYVTPSDTPWRYEWFNPEPIYDIYDTSELVRGWIPTD
jgi:hypothetical protein